MNRVRDCLLLGSRQGAAMIEMWKAVWRNLEDFAEQGGPVIWLLLLVSAVMWTLIGERLLYLLLFARNQTTQSQQQWMSRGERSSWFAHQVREALIVDMNLRLNQFLPLIRALVLLCPLLGLLGTVTGMVTVFDVIALEGTSDAQSMARGVFRATLPTMAGLVISISGLYMLAQLQRWTQDRLERFKDGLTFGVPGGDGYKGEVHGNP
ncbi:MAG: biopolymer transporter ExbB [Pseudomonadales bacterium]|nr:biopolymer transporter ExbB [Pseudomonadales bacterium]